MLDRQLNILISNSFILLGARGVGKTKLIKRQFSGENTLYIDLLDPDQFEKYLTDPARLLREVKGLAPSFRWVLIDEIQKLPVLLDVVHKCLEETTILFGLTGSSARKLKHGSANLLAGRAFTYNMFPLTSEELKSDFNLQRALVRGTLPKSYLAPTDNESQAYLRTYAQVYLKEEIQTEQLVRRLEPFRKFLSIAAQMNGEILNFSRIAYDVGVSDVTVKSYFSILEDTLLGYYLEPYHRSVRKRQIESPKFYLFDCGVQRALANLLTVNLVPTSSDYGKAFEHFVICEFFRLSSYKQNDFQFYYLRTKDGAEIDLIVERPGRPLALIEIKSTTKVNPEHAQHLRRFRSDFAGAEAFILSCDPVAQQIEHISCLPWQDGLSAVS